MGGATVAASMSTAAVAVLFGAAGAGLATYKMDKRTSGITEFRIESYPNKDQVCSCLSSSICYLSFFFKRSISQVVRCLVARLG